MGGGARASHPEEGKKSCLEYEQSTIETYLTQFGDAASMQVIQEGGQYHVKVKIPIVRG